MTMCEVAQKKKKQLFSLLRLKEGRKFCQMTRLKHENIRQQFHRTSATASEELHRIDTTDSPLSFSIAVIITAIDNNL